MLESVKENIGIYEINIFDLTDLGDNLDGHLYKILVKKKGKPFKGFGMDEIESKEDIIKFMEKKFNLG